jgi:hypothetical protein
LRSPLGGGYILSWLGWGAAQQRDRERETLVVATCRPPWAGGSCVQREGKLMSGFVQSQLNWQLPCYTEVKKAPYASAAHLNERTINAIPSPAQLFDTVTVLPQHTGVRTPRRQRSVSTNKQRAATRPQHHRFAPASTPHPTGITTLHQHQLRKLQPAQTQVR